MGVVSELYDLYDIARKEGWLDRLLAQFRKKHRILILGSTGTGKSQIRSSMWDLTEQAIDSSHRTEFDVTERLEINKNLFEFIDVPGQIHHRDRRLDAIREAVGRGVTGIINVVAYGYHEYNLDDLSQVFDRDGLVRQDYLESHREIELDALAEWTPILGGKELANWLITIANKSDLWHGDESSVLEYYKAGSYYDALGDAKALNPITIPYCATIHKFYNLGPNSAGFDDGERMKRRNNFFRVLLEAIGKGGTR